MLDPGENKSNSELAGSALLPAVAIRRHPSAHKSKKKYRTPQQRFTMALDFAEWREIFSSMLNKAVSAGLRSKLLRSAKKVMKNAHAPYSKFRVGAAVLLSNGKMFLGCNVENASYGMTNCAERTAIFSAVAQLGPKIEIRAVAVVNDHGVPCSPCGACRQVIYEFGPNATIFFQGAKGPKQAHITDLLPEGFRLQ
jgi:cytidine deaminase